MKFYIRATGNISPQETLGDAAFPGEPLVYHSNRLHCVEPDYKDLIDPKMIRRMSRIIKMGVAAAAVCLKEANVTVPDAIITGTSYGCLQDTDIFLTKMVEQQEDLLTPTAFIQSTHNTIGAQIGLMLKSNNYNNTFVHRGFSFESALLDAMMLLMENPASNALVGAVDEITDNSHAILGRFGLYKKEPVSNLELYKKTSRGTIAGEGAAFFLLTNEPSEKNYAELKGMQTFYKPVSITETEARIKSFLELHETDINDIDLVITGKNGNTREDALYEKLSQTIFNKAVLANFKKLCGEYPTATAFALWLAAKIIQTNTVPPVLDVVENKNREIKKILIYNNYQNTHHSLLLVSAC